MAECLPSTQIVAGSSPVSRPMPRPSRRGGPISFLTWFLAVTAQQRASSVMGWRCDRLQPRNGTQVSRARLLGARKFRSKVESVADAGLGHWARRQFAPHRVAVGVARHIAGCGRHPGAAIKRAGRTGRQGQADRQAKQADKAKPACGGRVGQGEQVHRQLQLERTSDSDPPAVRLLPGD